MNRLKGFFTKMNTQYVDCLVEGSMKSPSGELVDDDDIKWPIDIKKQPLTIESVCEGYQSHEHRFVKPSNGKYYCSLCLDKWINNTYIFSKCKNCEFVLCEKCYDTDVLAYD